MFVSFHTLPVLSVCWEILREIVKYPRNQWLNWGWVKRYDYIRMWCVMNGLNDDAIVLCMMFLKVYRNLLMVRFSSGWYIWERMMLWCVWLLIWKICFILRVRVLMECPSDARLAIGLENDKKWVACSHLEKLVARKVEIKWSNVNSNSVRLPHNIKLNSEIWP